MSKQIEFNEKTKEAFKNKVFVRNLLNLETGEQVRSALKEKGIVLSADELDKFAEVLIVALEKGDQMTDDDLKAVVGGVKTEHHLHHSGMEILAPGSLQVIINSYGNNYKEEIGFNKLSHKSYFGKVKHRVIH